MSTYHDDAYDGPPSYDEALADTSYSSALCPCDGAGGESYHYKPLTAPTAFRLLELLPGPSHETIRCHLSDEDLDRPPAYTALSYEWNLIPGSEIVEVDGRPLEVRRNLVLFFNMLRANFRTPIVLWADAICINQGDTSERGHQVQLMRRIFSSARHVSSWLGPPKPELLAAMTLCSLQPWTLREVCAWNRGALSSGWKQYLINHCGDRFFPGHETPQTERLRIMLDDMTSHIIDLCQQRYWSRLWIMPEILLGRDVTLFCGNTSANLEDLLLFATWMNHTIDYANCDPELRETLVTIAGHYKALRDLRRHIKRGDDVTFPELLRIFRQSECLDLRDRAYAVIGLASPQNGEVLPIAASYTATAGQVFLRTLDWCLFANQFEYDLYDALLDSLHLTPLECLDSLLNEGVDEPWSSARVFQPSAQLPLKKHLPDWEKYSSVDGSCCYRLPGDEMYPFLVTGQPLSTGDAVFRVPGTGIVVVCREEVASEHMSGITKSRKLVGFGVRLRKASRHQDLPTFWYGYRPDGYVSVEDDIIGRRSTHSVTLSLFDLVVAHALFG